MYRRKKMLAAMLITNFMLFTASANAASASVESQNARTTKVVSFASNALTRDHVTGNDELTYKIYLPKGYDEHRADGYPVLYLLHGSWGDETGWDDFWETLDGMIESGDIDPVIAVAPSSGNSYWVDSAKFGAYESAITQDLIAKVDQDYNTVSDRKGRYVLGYSMGGYGALRYAMAYPDLFGAATLLSPAIQRDEPPATSGAVERGSFGDPYDPSLWTANNYPTAIDSYVKQPNRVPVYIFAGDDDWNHLSEKEDLPPDAYKYNMEVQAVRLYQELNRKNIFNLPFEKWEDVPGSPAELRIINGEHDTDLWLIGFRDGLRYMLGKAESDELSPSFSADQYAPKRKGAVTTETASLVSLAAGVDAENVADAADGNEMSYRLYLPHGYNPDGKTRYPVMYLLHGSGGTETSWDKFWPILDTMIEEKKIPPVIAVAPVTGNSYWVDSDKFGAVESAVIRDLIPLVDRSYKTIASRGGRGLVGFSMGGYGALRYSLAYPDLFGGATLLSPAIQDGEAPATSGAVERGSFGEPFDPARWTELGYPNALKSYATKKLAVPMYMIAGDDDWNHLSEKEDLPADANKYNMEVQAVSLYQKLHRSNLFDLPFEKWENVPGSPAELRIVNGGHDMNVWAAGFEQGLPYMFANGLQAATAGFKDLETHWAKADVDSLAAKGIVTGRTDSEFAPDAAISRAEFAALLARALGLKANMTADTDAAFADVPSGEWYSEDVVAAAEAGIVKGNGNGMFQPNKAITREEIAVLIARALKASGDKASESGSGQTADFTDESRISGWASDAVKQMAQAGIIQGYPDGSFGPHRQATRAQSAVILNRMLDSME
ncbi:alpha/beta fold hydrolase [Paenibacillus sp. LHD-117]|uniref:alpha/beta fold hydrolase n=1 Tax=Paenibacillus sp. LHD-117 TaxID=3071412 RepID=UPI0027E1BE56|nr:alpha/beta fold hydrolase [Paenibacillus sp. LHD-117]MDQ6421485.1 alpha/beta fold hydrolase [Paenibacillus sp. LHD-117]